MRKLIASVGATLGLAVLIAATSPAGTALLAGIALNGLD
jgi:hypothetical protein